jgi:hypothetical protein
MGGVCSTHRIDEKLRNVYKILVENLGVDGRIMLEWILKK